MGLQKGNEKDRFLAILGQAEYELMDGAEIPYIPKRTFGVAEYDYIKGICHYIEKMIKYYDFRGWLAKQEYDAADVSEVVRCRECHHMDLAYLYCHEWEAVTEEDGYCYKGEKE